MLRWANAPTLDLIWQDLLLQFGTKVNIRVSDGTGFQDKILVNTSQYLQGIVMYGHDIVNVSKDIGIVMQIVDWAYLGLVPQVRISKAGFLS